MKTLPKNVYRKICCEHAEFYIFGMWDVYNKKMEINQNKNI